MSDIDHKPVTTPAAKPGVSYIEWGAIFAGAVVSGALTVVLTQFGAGIGLATAEPTLEDGLTWAIFLVGLWLVLIPFASASAGGYVAGRMRSHFGDGTEDESEFRDGIHGIVVWALATVAMGLAAGVSAAVSSAMAPAAADPEVSAEMMQLMQSASTITAFAAGAGAVLGAAGAWFAAVAGGNHRDEGIAISAFRGPFFRRTQP